MHSIVPHLSTFTFLSHDSSDMLMMLPLGLFQVIPYSCTLCRCNASMTFLFTMELTMGLCAHVGADNVVRRGAGLEVVWRPALSGWPQVQPPENHGPLRWGNHIPELLSAHGMQHRDYSVSQRLMWHEIMTILEAMCTTLRGSSLLCNFQTSTAEAMAVQSGTWRARRS